MLGYVLVRQPTVILRRKSECLVTCTSNIMPFLFITVTTVTPVMPVMPVIFDADVLFSILFPICNCNYFVDNGIIEGSGQDPL